MRLWAEEVEKSIAAGLDPRKHAMPPRFSDQSLATHEHFKWEESNEYEQQLDMEPYDEILSTLDDYQELAVQFGLVILFASSFPMAPLIARRHG